MTTTSSSTESSRSYSSIHGTGIFGCILFYWVPLQWPSCYIGTHAAIFSVCHSLPLIYWNYVVVCVCLNLCAWIGLWISHYFPLSVMFMMSVPLYRSLFYCIVLPHTFLNLPDFTYPSSQWWAPILPPTVCSQSHRHISMPGLMLAPWWLCTKAYTEAQVEKMPRCSRRLASRR